MKSDDFLRSWKEIAAYLECDRRTCLRWEKTLGLPIHRREGSGKGGVFAYRDELDKWLARRVGRPEPAKTGTEVLEEGRRWARLEIRRQNRRCLLGMHLVFLAAVTAGYVFLLSRHMQPSVPRDFRIEGSELVVLGDGGRVLFRHDTALKNLLDERGYREHFQKKMPFGRNAWQLPTLAFFDIDRDGHLETIFTIQTEDEIGEGEILCLDVRGGEKWHFKAGRQLEFGGQIYSSDYRISGFDFIDLDHDGRQEILLFAMHRPDWPCQFAVLSSAGRLLGEFWNSGYFADFAVADLNGDGREEVILGGVNNEYGQGVAAVFDSAEISGSSPQTDRRFRCEMLKPGSEKFYIRFPRTDVDIGEYPVESVASTAVNQSREISFLMQLSGLCFEFDFGLGLRRVRNSHQFMRLHQAAREAGRVKSVLNEDYLRALGSRVLYWDGDAGAWTGRTAMAARW
jgi:hypothetical protein